ncbi:hypothetical protein Vadar_003053 [Vaccinium darrowii]|uniref:Uncharacterized protein n=1 Tax=Vaccinium darrowii TaxID=229202 RepID=A0ACB7Y671_9ERIC|nr:hypothetical protein Vadar_003053 [Vaccinium darrowii]
MFAGLKNGLPKSTFYPRPSNELERTSSSILGSVSIIVRGPLKPPPKLKLVAREGKLEIDEEEVGMELNGTEFTIATKNLPELSVVALVVGRLESFGGDGGGAEY